MNDSPAITAENTAPFHGPLNVQPPRCIVCGANHEPEYPHENTPHFRARFFMKNGRNATQYDLLAHTKGVIRESSMVACLQQLEVQ